MTLKVAIVDNEPLSLARLVHLLHEEDGVEVVFSTRSATKAVDAVLRLRPDLVFLDTHLSGLNGLEAASLIRNNGASDIIFVTAHSQYALDAFNLEAADYLLKPISPARLKESLRRARRRRSEVVVTAEHPKAIDSRNLLHFPDRYGGFDIAQSDIIWIEAAKDYAVVHTDCKSLMIRATMSDLSQQLHPSIVRVHRSAYVAVKAIKRTTPVVRGVFSLILSDQTEVQVGPTYTRAIRRVLRDRALY